MRECNSGELRSCDTPALARAISATAGGSLIAWAVFREGTAEQWVRADLETLLTLYCTMSVRSSRKRRKR